MNGVLPPTAAVLHEAEEALAAAEQSGENVALAQGRQYVGLMLVRLGGNSRARGFQLLEQVRAMTLEQRYNLSVVPLIDVHVAQEKTRVGDFAGAISQSRAAVNEFFELGNKVWTGYATNVLVDALTHSGSDADLQEAKVAVDRLAALQIEPGVVVHELWVLRARALLARACGDEVTYHEPRYDYRKMVAELGFEGHIAMAEAVV